MVPSGSHFHNVGQEGYYTEGNIEIFHSDGTVGGRLHLHSDWQEDGAIRAQLELRFEDKSSLVTIAEAGLADEGYAPGRSWVLVEMVPRKSFTEPLRFSIDIPGPTPSASGNAGDAEAASAAVRQARDAISAVRKRCGNSDNCNYPVCQFIAYGLGGKLADDRCVAELESLETLSLHASDPDSQ